ncbi:Ig-like domain-containing protein, partial [Thorsellia kenyensis]
LLVSGRAEAGVTIILRVNGKPVAEQKVGADGKWSITIPENEVSESGEYKVTAIAKDAAGQDSEPTGDYIFNFDGSAPSKPLMPSLTDSVGDKQGPVQGGGIIDDETPVLRGQAESGDSVVTIYNNGVKVGLATVNADGSWSYTLSLKQGPQNITVTETDKAGNTSEPSDNFNFVVDS